VTTTPPTSPSTTASPRPVRPGRIAAASFVGTAIEWYDYFIYGMAAAVVFGPQFFPQLSPLAGTLAAFSTYAVGFLARPLGGIVMGHYGDRVGRKSMLVISLLLMGFATVGIGLLPTYAAIGIAAPALLVALRFLQGIGVGGEWGAAVLMAVEHAPPNRRTLYGSFPQMGVPGGLILATLAYLVVSTGMSPEAFQAWGWRLPFLASGILVVVGIVIRVAVEESPAFRELDARHGTERMPLLTVLREHRAAVLLIAGGFIAVNSIGYVTTVYVLSYGTSVLELGRPLVLACSLAAGLAWLVAVPIASVLADRRGARTIVVGGSAGLAVGALTLFPLIDTGLPVLLLVALVLTSAFLGVVYGPLAAVYARAFPTRVRYSGISLGYQVGAILGGGIAPSVAIALYAAWGGSTLITVYLTAAALLSLGCLAVLTRRPPPGNRGTLPVPPSRVKDQ
jgi:metabolite-proton symporter